MKAAFLIVLVGPILISALSEVFYTWREMQPNDEVLERNFQQQGPLQIAEPLTFTFVYNGTDYSTFTLTGDRGYLDRTTGWKVVASENNNQLSVVFSIYSATGFGVWLNVYGSRIPISEEKEVFYTKRPLTSNDRVIATYPQQQGPFTIAQPLTFTFAHNGTDYSTFTLTGDRGYLNRTTGWKVVASENNNQLSVVFSIYSATGFDVLLTVFGSPLPISEQKEVFYTKRPLTSNDRVIKTYPQQQGPFETAHTLTFVFSHVGSDFSTFSLTGDRGYLNRTGGWNVISSQNNNQLSVALNIWNATGFDVLLTVYGSSVRATNYILMSLIGLLTVYLL